MAFARFDLVGRRLGLVTLSVLTCCGAGGAEAQGVTGYRILLAGGGSMSISKGRVKLDPGSAWMALGYEPDAGRLWMANRSRQTYWEGTIEEYCVAARQERATAEERALAQLGHQVPPDLREKVRVAMERQEEEKESGPPAGDSAERPAVTVHVEPTGKTATIAGQPTQEFRVLANGKPHERLWISSEPALAREMNFANLGPLMSRAQACVTGDAIAQMKQRLDQYRDPISRRAVGADRFDAMLEGKQLKDAVQASSEYRQLLSRGWPLKTVRETAAATEITRLERIELLEADFRPPAAFKKVAPAEVMDAPPN